MKRQLSELGEKKMQMKQLTKINCQNIQTAHAAHYQKANKQPNQEMGRKHKQTFIHRKHAHGQQTHNKMFNITTRNSNQTKRNANQLKTAMCYPLTLVCMLIFVS